MVFAPSIDFAQFRIFRKNGVLSRRICERSVKQKNAPGPRKRLLRCELRDPAEQFFDSFKKLQSRAAERCFRRAALSARLGRPLKRIFGM